MKYLIIGAGGTGGCIAGYMQSAGKDVTLIARGKHLEIIKQNGLTIHKQNDSLNIKLNAVTEAEHNEKADVIFVCVKYYSIEQTYELIKKSAHEKTIVIPVLNVYGTGEKMSKTLTELEVLNGCIYIAGAIEDYGVLRQSGEIFRVVYGRLDGKTDDERLQKIKQDLLDSNIEVILSDDVRKDTMQKFSFISCMAACGAYFDATALDFKKEGEKRETFISCVKEIDALSKAMDINLPENIVEINLEIMQNLGDDVTASMQKDLKKGGNSEIDGLVFEVERLGEKYGVAMPTYNMICKKLK